MPTEAKRETVAALKEELSASTTLIVSEYRGLKVGEIAEIRRSLRKQDVSYRVVKNRLMRIAATESGNEALPPFLEGPTAIAFGSGDEATIAKAVLDATRPYKIVKVKGAVLSGRAIDADGVTRLATLPVAGRAPGPDRRRDRGPDGHPGRAVRRSAARRRRGNRRARRPARRPSA